MSKNNVLMRRRKYVLTNEEKQRVHQLSMLGMSISEVSKFLNLTEKIVREQAQREFDLGRLQGCEDVLSAAKAMAMSQKNPAVTMWWIDRQLGWSDNKGKTGSTSVTTSIELVNTDKMKKMDPIEASRIYQKIMSE